MKYLLDTHTLLWLLFEDEKLSEKAKTIIQNSDNEILKIVLISKDKPIKEYKKFGLDILWK